QTTGHGSPLTTVTVPLQGSPQSEVSYHEMGLWLLRIPRSTTHFRFPSIETDGLVATILQHHSAHLFRSVHRTSDTPRPLWDRSGQPERLRTCCNCFQLSRWSTFPQPLSSSKCGRKSAFQPATLALRLPPGPHKLVYTFSEQQGENL